MTTQATHTPGPWKSVKGARPTRPDIVADCGLICSLEYGPDEGEANAHLIKAAPDMLEALRRARDSIADMFAGMQFHPDHKDIEAPLLVALSNARAAITKAEGRAE
jgi:hypothetical protein